MTAADAHPRRWAILPVLCLSLFLVVVDNTIVNVALPTLSRDLAASTSQLQWIVDAYSLVFAGLLLAAGSLGDRLGRKRALQFGLVAFTAMSIVASRQTSAGGLIASRALMGIGAAFVFPATLAILTNVFTDPVERAKAIGAWAGVSGLAVAMGPISGGWLLRHFWWGSIFFVNVPIVVIALVAGAVLIPESKDPHAGRLDLGGLVLSITGVTLLIYSVIEAPSHGWTSGRTLFGIVGGLVLLGAFVLWERRMDEPMLDVTVFSNLRFSAASVAVMVAFFSLFGFIFLITQYFQFVRGYDTLSAGLHTLPFAFAAGIVAPFSARLALRFGTKRVVGFGLGLMSVGFVQSALIDAGSSYWLRVVPSMVCIAAGLSFTTAPSTDAIMGSLPADKAGVGSAVNDTTRELGGTLGVAIVGSVFSSLYGPHLVDRLAGLPIPAEGLAAARESVAAAFVVASRAPEAGRAAIQAAARSSFVDGLHAGSLVTAGMSLAGALFALAFLPSRPTQVGDQPS